MQSLKCFFVICWTFLTVAISAVVVPEIDSELINQLQLKQIRLIVIRHAEATHNLIQLLTSSDTPGIYLTELGEQQAKDLADKLVNEQISALYVSPIYRSLQTAQLIMKLLQISHDKAVVDGRLREQNFGIYEGKSFADYRAYFNSKEDMFMFAVPQGETGVNVFSRGYSLLREIAEKHQNETILLVTHGLNACQISKCLRGVYGNIPGFAEPQIYDFTASKPSAL